MGKLKFFIAFSIVVFLILFAPSLSSAALNGNATQATLTVSPATGSYNPNDTFTVSIYMNTNGQNVVVAAAYLNYDKNSFQAMSIDTSGSVFTMETEKIIDSSNGIIKITRGIPTPGVNTASGLVAKINFKALYGTTPSADNLTFRFAAGDSTQSTVIKNDGLGTNILSGVYNGKYTVSGQTNPSPAPSPYCGDGSCNGSETCSSCASDCGTCPVPTPTPTPTPISETLTGPFSIGMTSEQVKVLQQMLATDPAIYPEGIISGYYGELTVKAVQNFQCKYNIICGGEPYTTGYGLAGPTTRQKLNEIYGGEGSVGQIPADKQALIEQLKAQVKQLQQLLMQLLSQLAQLLQQKIQQQTQ